MPEAVIEDHVSVDPNVEDFHVELWVKGKHVKLTVENARVVARILLECAETVARAKDSKATASEPDPVPGEPEATQPVDHHSV